MVCLYIPFYFLWKLLRLNDVWFIAFKIHNLSEQELYLLEKALKRRIKSNKISSFNKWINNYALNKTEKAIQQLK